MIKLVTLLKRRTGMGLPDFRAYYEAHHAAIGVKYLKGGAAHYSRRYLTPLPNPLTGEAAEPEHDVITEVWFADQAAFDATMARLTSPDAAAEIAADEARLFDTTRIRHFTVDEVESVL